MRLRRAALRSRPLSTIINALDDLAIWELIWVVPRRYQSGEVDYTGNISKCGDRRVRTLRYEAANVILMRYKGALKLKEGALAIARRSTLRKALAPAARHHHARHAPTRHRVQTGLALNCTRGRRPKTSSRTGATPEGGSG